VANPKAWLPYFGETGQKRVTFVGAALVLSLGLHVAIPASGMFHRVAPISDQPVVFELVTPPPMPMPEADKQKMAPDDKDLEAPDDDEPVQAEEEPEEKAPTPDDAPPAEPPPAAAQVDPPPEQLAKDPPPELADNAAQKDPNQAKADAEERERRRQERIAERRRRLEERRRQRASGGEKGGAPDSGDWKTGKPDSVYACTATARGEELQVHKARPLDEWATILPTLLAGFRTKPDIGDYLDGTTQIVSRERKSLRRIGFVEMALPSDVLSVELDSPRGTKLHMGRSDGRCLVGFRYTVQIFPFVVQRVPMRIIEGKTVTEALVDITFYKDVSFDLKSVDGTVLPFNKGRLKNGNAIAQNIEDHYQAARLAKSIADMFGIQLGSHSSSSSSSSSSSGAASAGAKGSKKGASATPNIYKALAEGKPFKQTD
jgi:hypothetical protein